MAFFKYLLQDVLSRQVLGSVPLTGVTFNDPIGTAGSFSGTYTLGVTGEDDVDAAVGNYAQTTFNPDQTLIHCIWPETNEIVATYLLISTDWDPTTNQLTLQGTQMQAWLSECYPENPPGGLPWVFGGAGVDQLVIAATLISQYVKLGPKSGVPSIIVPSLTANPSGVLVSLTISDTLSSDLASLINQFAQNYQGFDWEIYADWNPNDGLPQLYLGLYYPEKSTGGETSSLELFFDSTPSGGNLTTYWPWPTDATNRASNIVVSATSDIGLTFYAQWLDGRFGNLVTPMSQGGECLGDYNKFTPLRRTKVGSLPTSNFDTATLNGVVTQLGTSLSQASGAPIIAHHPLNPNVGGYRVGDRARVRIVDEYLAFDLPSVRVVDRAITDEDPNTVASVSVTLDFTDQNNPADSI